MRAAPPPCAPSNATTHAHATLKGACAAVRTAAGARAASAMRDVGTFSADDVFRALDDARSRALLRTKTAARGCALGREGRFGMCSTTGARAATASGARAAVRGRDGEGAEGEDAGEDATGDAALWDGVPGHGRQLRGRRASRGGVVREVVVACEDGGELEISSHGKWARDATALARGTPLCAWAHGMRGDLNNDDEEGLWDFWKYCDVEDDAVDGDGGGAESRATARGIGVIRYNARGYGASSDVRRTREARWDNRGSDMIELARRVRKGNGGKVVFCGASLGAATSIWAAVLAYESGVAEDAPAALVIVTPPTFYEERESRKKKLKAKVAKGAAVENTKAPRRVFAAARDPVVPEPPSLANPNDSCAVEVLIGSAQSNLPEPERVRDALRDIPVICLAWDCGDVTHPVSSAMVIKDLVPHAEIVVASSKEDYDIVKHVRAEWSNAILEFIQRNVISDDEGTGGGVGKENL